MARYNPSGPRVGHAAQRGGFRFASFERGEATRRRIMEAIHTLRERLGQDPNVVELLEECGLSPTSTGLVYTHLKIMENQGHALGSLRPRENRLKAQGDKARDAIVACFEKHRMQGLPGPVVRELQEATGLSSSSSVSRHLSILVSKGVLDAHRGKYYLVQDGEG